MPIIPVRPQQPFSRTLTRRKGVRVVIAYEDDTTQEGSFEEWADLRSDGVQAVTLIRGRYRNVFSGASLYWLYQEGENWIAGQTGVHYDPSPITEIITEPTGRQYERQSPYLPDMSHTAMKLGWWNGQDLLHT